MTRWMREPLVHFLVLGGLIFALNAYLNGNSGSSRDEIVITARQQDNLLQTFSRTWQRPPTQAEFDGLILDYIRQEIAYRESQKMQLDRDDIVIRRRLRQKLEMLTEDIASLEPPSDEDLQAYLEEHPDDFRVPATVSMEHIYFNVDDDVAAARLSAESLLSELQRDAASVDLNTAGDPSMLPPSLSNVRQTELANLFGSEFAADVVSLEPGDWTGPIESGFGLHLVRVNERIDGRDPSLEEAYEVVKRELMTVRRKSAIDGLYERMAENYEIVIEERVEVDSASDPESDAAP